MPATTITALAALALSEQPPLDWSTLPSFPLPRAVIVTEGTSFVRRELTERCAGGTDASQSRQFAMAVAILVADAGHVRRVTPRAVGCPTVEQYTAGYVLSLTRGGPGSLSAPAPGWYRLTVTYRW